MTATPVDLSTYTDDELTALAAQVSDERWKRSVAATAAANISRINADVLVAQGVARGGAWSKPAGATDAYPIGWTVTHNSATWKSLIPANTTEPGDPADPQNYLWWQNLSTTPTPGAWDGNGHAYSVGDLVTYNGGTYKCVQAHTSQPDWTPVATPALWQPVAQM